MSDVKALEAAAARLEADASLPHRLAGECRRIENVARQRHPLGYAALDAELAAGLAAASFFPPGAEQLLLVEKLHRAMEQRSAEADAQIARENAAASALQDARYLEMRAGGAVGKPGIDDDFFVALRTCRKRFDYLPVNAVDEAELSALLDDAENAIKAFSSAAGLARRASRIRLAAARADAAVASLATAA